MLFSLHIWGRSEVETPCFHPRVRVKCFRNYCQTWALEGVCLVAPSSTWDESLPPDVGANLIIKALKKHTFDVQRCST